MRGLLEVAATGIRADARSSHLLPEAGPVSPGCQLWFQPGLYWALGCTGPWAVCWALGCAGPWAVLGPGLGFSHHGTGTTFPYYTLDFYERRLRKGSTTKKAWKPSTTPIAFH